MTIKEARIYETAVGRFSYVRIKRNAFNIGIRNVEENGYSFLLASPEKALCDLIASTPGLNLRYLKDATAYLEEDIRFDMDIFYRLKSSLFERYIAVHGKKSNSIKTILTLLSRHGK